MTQSNEQPGLVTVSHVLDSYNRYPGEVATFYTRIESYAAISNLTLRITLPDGFMVGEYLPPPQQEETSPQIEAGSQANYVVWPIDNELAAGATYEYQLETIIPPLRQDITPESKAEISNGNGEVLAAETVRLAIGAKGRYLQYLPSVFERDELLGRFLMLFESFWTPIELQTDSIPYYFDPRMAPPEFLPWLASWLDLELDERWPEERLRRLIRWAIALHRSRGTKWGLLKYLEIYTGRQAKVVEKISNNFVVGPYATLGPAIALGKGNQPHTFSVSLRLPWLDIEDKNEQARQEKIRRRTLESIIEMQMPGHTMYTLNLEIADPAELDKEPQESEEVTEGAASEEEIDEIAAQAAIWFKLDDE